jgi:hypothetical protein
MRTLAVALVAAAGLMTAAVATGAFAAEPTINPAVKPPLAAVPQQAQYYPGYRPYWDNPYYYRHHHHYWYRGYDRWRYSDAEELNQQELDRLGVAP